MSEAPHKKSFFPAGFERDFKALLLAVDMKQITRDEFRRIVGDCFDLSQFYDAPIPAERMLPTPALARPSLEEPQPEFGYFEDDPDHVFEVHTGAVFNAHTGEHVGFLEPEAEVLVEEQPEPEEPEVIGPPPEGSEFDDDDELLLAAKIDDPDYVAPPEDEQIDGGTPQ